MSYKLYNGIELPDIDTVWTDKETYPYAYMICNYLEPTDDPHLSCYLIFSSEPLYHKYEVKNIANKYRYLYTKTDCRCVKYTYSKSEDLQYGTQWYDETASETASDNYAWHTVTGGIYDALWCNVDLYNYDDNTLYLEGEVEPETEETTAPVTPYLCKNGAWVKHDIYKQVGNTWVKQPQGAVEVEGGAWSALS